MYFPAKIIEDVGRVARIHYVNVNDARNWNQHRRDGELRMLTGWCWTERGGDRFRQGFKTLSVAYRDAWYELVQQTSAPRVRPLRVVSSRRVA